MERTDNMQITFTEDERKYFYKLLLLKARMEQDSRAARFWVDLAEQFAHNRSAANLKVSHLTLLLDIIKSVRDTISVELTKDGLEEKRKTTLNSIITLLEAAGSKITQKLLSTNQGE